MQAPARTGDGTSEGGAGVLGSITQYLYNSFSDEDGPRQDAAAAVPSTAGSTDPCGAFCDQDAQIAADEELARRVQERDDRAESDRTAINHHVMLGAYGEFYDWHEYGDGGLDLTEDIQALVSYATDFLTHAPISLIVTSQSAYSEAMSVPQTVVDYVVGSPPVELKMSVKPPGSTQKVLIVYLDTGGGHRSAAQSLAAALERTWGSRVEVELMELSQYLPPPWCYSTEIYAWLGQHPSIYERLWKADEHLTDFRKSKFFNNIRWNTISHLRELVTRLLNKGTDLFLSVHPFLNHLASDVVESVASYNNVDGPLAKVATVVTDLGTAHLSWFDVKQDAIFVPTEALRDRAIKLDIRPECIYVSGLPVRQGFWEPVTLPKQAWREKLSLAVPSGDKAEDEPEPEGAGTETFVILLMGGGEGFGELEATAIAVGDRLARAEGLRSQLVVACGRNEATRQALTAREWPSTPLPPVILGFTSNMDEYMSAADVLITKAGPGSIAEAAIRELPCLITSFLPGQEEGNVTYVTEAGAGEFVSDQDPAAVAECLLRWLREPDRLKQMSTCISALARPKATLDIAQLVGEHLLGFEDG